MFRFNILPLRPFELVILKLSKWAIESLSDCSLKFVSFTTALFTPCIEAETTKWNGLGGLGFS
jgi:hypothetical protein